MADIPMVWAAWRGKYHIIRKCTSTLGSTLKWNQCFAMCGEIDFAVPSTKGQTPTGACPKCMGVIAREHLLNRRRA